MLSLLQEKQARSTLALLWEGIGKYPVARWTSGRATNKGMETVTYVIRYDTYNFQANSDNNTDNSFPLDELSLQTLPFWFCPKVYQLYKLASCTFRPKLQWANGETTKDRPMTIDQSVLSQFCDTWCPCKMR